MPDVFISDQEKENNSTTGFSTSIPSTEAQKMNMPGHNHNKLSSFCLYPEGVDFETREKEEKIILLLRAHVITNLKWILVTILMLTVPGIIQAFGMFNTLPAGFGLVITLGWYLVTTAYALESFLFWYFNVYIITNIRVVDVDFYNLIYKQVSDANISKIQDVTYNMGGVVRTIFNYGDVFVQTAAEVSEFDFLAVPNPDKVAKIIQEMITEEDNKHD